MTGPFFIVLKLLQSSLKGLFYYWLYLRYRAIRKAQDPSAEDEGFIESIKNINKLLYPQQNIQNKKVE